MGVRRENPPLAHMAAAFEVRRGESVEQTVLIETGGEIGPFTVASLDVTEQSGLRAARDPGYILVLVSLLLVASGLALTFIQKISEASP